MAFSPVSEPEPPVADARDQELLPVVVQRAVVDPEHQRRGVGACPEHLHDADTGRAARHIAVSLELPHPRGAVVSLSSF